MPKLLHILVIALYYVIRDVECKGLRKNAELFSFNTEVNAVITKKVQDEAVILTLERKSSIPDETTKSHVLFGFDIFHFVPQSFSVSVDYPNKVLLLNLTSILNSYSIKFKLKNDEPIKSLDLRLGDEDDTIFIQVNCQSSGLLVTPINIIKFFRTVAKHKFKILFNKYYMMNAYTEGDQIEEEFQKRCDAKQSFSEEKDQVDLELDHLAGVLVKFTRHLQSFLFETKKRSKIATEIFIKAFLTKDVVHQTANMYRSVHLIQTLTRKFSYIFQTELQGLLAKIFWTQGKEHRFVRKRKSEYFIDITIKNNLLNTLFSGWPRTFHDSLRNISDIGSRFRNVFLNPSVSINQIVRNETQLTNILLDVLFVEDLDADQLYFLNPPHIVRKMFAYYYLMDTNVNPSTLNNIHKRFIFNADKKDYIAIGKFIRYVFFKDSAMYNIKHFIESDLMIGMRIVYLLASGQINENQNIYWTIRNLITRKDVELPKALEYPEQVIINTIQRCYMSPMSSRFLFMQTLENIIIYDVRNIGHILDHDQGIFIYNLYKDLILSDISKEKSILKEVLLENSAHIHGTISSMFQAVVSNADKDENLAHIAANFVNDTMAYAKLDTTSVLSKSLMNYVTVFKKIVGKSYKLTENQKKINFKVMIVSAKFTGETSSTQVVHEAAMSSSLKLTTKMTVRLEHVYERYKSSTDTLVKKVDEVLQEKSRVESILNYIIGLDLKEGITFYNETSSNNPMTLFVRSEEENKVMEQERVTKLQELNMLEEWYSEQINPQFAPSKTTMMNKHVLESIKSKLEKLQKLSTDNERQHELSVASSHEGRDEFSGMRNRTVSNSFKAETNSEVHSLTATQNDVQDEHSKNCQTDQSLHENGDSTFEMEQENSEQNSEKSEMQGELQNQFAYIAESNGNLDAKMEDKNSQTDNENKQIQMEDRNSSMTEVEMIESTTRVQEARQDEEVQLAIEKQQETTESLESSVDAETDSKMENVKELQISSMDNINTSQKELNAHTVQEAERDEGVELSFAKEQNIPKELNSDDQIQAINQNEDIQDDNAKQDVYLLDQSKSGYELNDEEEEVTENAENTSERQNIQNFQVSLKKDLNTSQKNFEVSDTNTMQNDRYNEGSEISKMEKSNAGESESKKQVEAISQNGGTEADNVKEKVVLLDQSKLDHDVSHATEKVEGNTKTNALLESDSNESQDTEDDTNLLAIIDQKDISKEDSDEERRPDRPEVNLQDQSKSGYETDSEEENEQEQSETNDEGTLQMSINKDLDTSQKKFEVSESTNDEESQQKEYDTKLDQAKVSNSRETQTNDVEQDVYLRKQLEAKYGGEHKETEKMETNSETQDEKQLQLSLTKDNNNSQKKFVVTGSSNENTRETGQSGDMQLLLDKQQTSGSSESSKQTYGTLSQAELSEKGSNEKKYSDNANQDVYLLDQSKAGYDRDREEDIREKIETGSATNNEEKQQLLMSKDVNTSQKKFEMSGNSQDEKSQLLLMKQQSSEGLQTDQKLQEKSKQDVCCLQKTQNANMQSEDVRSVNHLKTAYKNNKNVKQSLVKKGSSKKKGSFSKKQLKSSVRDTEKSDSKSKESQATNTQKNQKGWLKSRDLKLSLNKNMEYGIQKNHAKESNTPDTQQNVPYKAWKKSKNFELSLKRVEMSHEHSGHQESDENRVRNFPKGVILHDDDDRESEVEPDIMNLLKNQKKAALQYKKHQISISKNYENSNRQETRSKLPKPDPVVNASGLKTSLRDQLSGSSETGDGLDSDSAELRPSKSPVAGEQGGPNSSELMLSKLLSRQTNDNINSNQKKFTVNRPGTSNRKDDDKLSFDLRKSLLGK